MRHETCLRAHRIWVSGAPAAGKTTFSRGLARALDLPHHELDALYWEKGWRPVANDAFRARLSDLVEKERWLIDGFYPQVVDLLRERVQGFIWLDVSLPTSMLRLLRRTALRLIRREPLWNGNVETWRSLLGRDSIIGYLMRSHGSTTRMNRRLQAELSGRGVQCIRLSDAAETDRLTIEAARAHHERKDR